MIDPLVYTLDDGLTYQIEFNKTKDHINFDQFYYLWFYCGKYYISLVKT